MNISRLINIYYNYFNKGSIWVGIALIALMCVYAFDKRIRAKRLFLYIPLLYIILLVINPFIYPLFEKLGVHYAYSRVYWFIPIMPVTAYFLVWAVKNGNNIQRIVLALAFIITAVSSGSFVYKAFPFRKVSNQYHLSQDIVDVADIILSDSTREGKKAIMPEEISRSTRIYTPRISVMFGASGWEMYYDEEKEDTNTINLQNRLYTEINSENPDIDGILSAAWALEWEYIVLPKGRATEEQMSAGWFNYVGSSSGYDVYGCLVVTDEMKKSLEQPPEEPQPEEQPLK